MGYCPDKATQLYNPKAPPSITNRKLAGAAGAVSSYKGPLDYNGLYAGVDLSKYWNYEGSFTTPPCTEAVDFYIYMGMAT